MADGNAPKTKRIITGRQRLGTLREEDAALRSGSLSLWTSVRSNSARSLGRLMQPILFHRCSCLGTSVKRACSSLDRKHDTQHLAGSAASASRAGPSGGPSLASSNPASRAAASAPAPAGQPGGSRPPTAKRVRCVSQICCCVQSVLPPTALAPTFASFVAGIQASGAGQKGSAASSTREPGRKWPVRP